jgi:hypothetical protein
VSNVLSIALSAKLDLAVVISYVFFIQIIFVLLCLISVSCCGTIKKEFKWNARIGRWGGGRGVIWRCDRCASLMAHRTRAPRCRPCGSA